MPHWVAKICWNVDANGISNQEWLRHSCSDSDINSLRNTVDNHFDGSTSNGNPASIPDSGALYSGYSGAQNALVQAYGDVAFAK